MSRRPRIAFVHNRYPAYRHCFFDLLAQQFEVDYFFVNEWGNNLPPNAQVLRGYQIPEMSDYEVVPDLLPILLRMSREKDYDIYVCTDLGYFITHVTFLIARLRKKPFVLWNGQWIEVAHPRRWLMKPFENQIVRQAGSLVAYSSKAKEFLVHRGADLDKIFVAHNASHYKYSKPSASTLAKFRTRIGGGDRRIVLFFGRFIPMKAPDLMVKAFAGVAKNFPDVYLIMAGTGPELRRVQCLVAKMGMGQVYLTGKITSSTEKDLLFASASVFVLPSRYARSAEPWGLVLNEAATAGLPLITTDMVGATGDLVIDGKSGLVVPADDVLALQQAIEWMFTHPEQSRQMGRRAQDIVSEFTPENMVKVFSNAFEVALTTLRTKGAD